MFRIITQKFWFKYLILLIPLVLIIFASTALISEFLINKTVLNSIENESLVLAIKKQNTEALLESIVSDALYLSTQATRYFEKYSNSRTFKSELAADFLNFSVARKIYDQVRFIDSSGMEIIRVNTTGHGPVLVPEEDLQDKRHRYYFKFGMGTDRDWYISPLDLNIEYGLVEMPIKPMLRFVTKVRDLHGETAGVIVLNYLSQEPIDQMATAPAGSDCDVLIVNSRGYWLHGFKPKDEWGFMFVNGKHKKIATRFPEEWSIIRDELSGHIHSENGLFIYTTIKPTEIINVFGNRQRTGFVEDSYKIIAYTSPEKLSSPYINTVYVIAIFLIIIYGAIILYRSINRFDEQVTDSTGFTLIELVMTIVIIGILSTIAMRTISSTLENARFISTAEEMNNIAWAITGNPELIASGQRSDFGYIGDTGQLPLNLDALVSDPGGVCNWGGPYLFSDFTENPDDYKTDAWGVPYALSISTDGILTISSDRAGTKAVNDTSHLMNNTVQVQLYNSDNIPLGGSSSEVMIEKPCGWVNMSYWSNRKSFVIETVPVGQYTIRGISGNDTTYKMITVLPGGLTNIEMYVYPTFGNLSSGGCATVSGTGNEIITENIENGDSPTYLVDKLTIAWSNGTCWNCETPYLEKVEVGVKPYWNWNTNGRTARVGSGTQIILDDDMEFFSGTTAIRFTFNLASTGTGGPVDMTASDINLTLHPTNAPAQLIAFSVCGTGCTVPTISLIPASIVVSGTDNNTINLDITNSGINDLITNQLVVTWENGNCWDQSIPYLESVDFNGINVWLWNANGNVSRASNGQTITLNQEVNFATGITSLTDLAFMDSPADPASTIDMRGVDCSLIIKSTCYGSEQISFSTPGSCSPCLLSAAAGTAYGSSNSTVDVDMVNTGSYNCGISQMKITCSANSKGLQPWLDTIKNSNTTFWTMTSEGNGSRGNTSAGSETNLVLRNVMNLGVGSVSISQIIFKDAISGGKFLDMRGVIMTIELTMSNCGGCVTPQNISFTVN